VFDMILVSMKVHTL